MSKSYRTFSILIFKVNTFNVFFNTYILSLLHWRSILVILQASIILAGDSSFSKLSKSSLEMNSSKSLF
ncbi:hypothetical protein [Orientia tsutsugamushi]|nr:hypothetical protein [Orientia tsutsugamushi]KJV55611.1 hypothetical protein OTSKATO_0616 [Orientia tsutsugamushi str. Kato PP]